MPSLSRLILRHVNFHLHVYDTNFSDVDELEYSANPFLDGLCTALHLREEAGCKVEELVIEENYNMSAKSMLRGCARGATVTILMIEVQM
ncbi:hypothetical protein EUX98_g8644 [Antrodiella citrinella]|uniref:Uncharacterized protein n=1 Tax=Antrodiella citrinella TaxID=2447956 RepID=A0A4S4M568_9APHY|nr:hypothetical protein EUX98_g8644 [Antrodiella citrinella]